MTADKPACRAARTAARLWHFTLRRHTARILVGEKLALQRKQSLVIGGRRRARSFREIGAYKITPDSDGFKVSI